MASSVVVAMEVFWGMVELVSVELLAPVVLGASLKVVGS